ncbi:MAG TPA: PKD domain-containing protein [Solirubrobacteraceae bacterium]|jgi:PKD repeat protein
MAAICAISLAAVGTVAARADAETVVNFDGLSAGELVTNQYEARGLRLGTAAELGQTSPNEGKGDCGAPTVRKEEPGVEAASSPNDAALPLCVSSGLEFSGTYGALLGNAGDRLGVDVRLLVAAGVPAEEVELVAYDGSGHSVANTKGNATDEGWLHMSVSLASAQIRYFEVRTVNAYNAAIRIGIDNLSFDQPTEGVGSHPPPPPPPPPPPAPPTADLALQTPSPTPGELLTLNGGASQPGNGRIISYAWDFNDDGKIDTSTGTNPIAHVMLRPGAHTIALTVTNSKGERSTTKLGVTLPPNGPKVHLPDGGEGECQPTLEIGDAELLAECIQKLGSGYVIEGPVQINGMTVVPTSGNLKIRTIKDYAIAGTATQLYGAQVDIELLNTPIGDMVLGSRDLEAEPMNLETQSGLANLHVPLYHGLRAPGARAAARPTKSLLMAIGVGKQCEGKEKGKAGCCPPKNALSACGELPGKFPLEGQIDVYLTNKGQALFDVQVGLTLSAVKFEATGALEIEANLETGIELQSLQFEIPEASLAPIFKVKKASFAYYFPEYYEESKRDSWQAKATMTFGEEIAELQAELAFKKGEFQSAAMKFKAEPGVPIYPGISLNEIGASVGVHPLAFGGILGAKIAELLQLELAFKFREATTTELGFFGGQGKLSYKGDEIATLAADVYSDGYVDAQVTFNLHFPFDSKEPIIEVAGGAGFWDEPSSGLWQARGNVYFKLWIISAEVAGLINNKWAAGCVHVGAEGIFGGGVQGRYRFSDGNISGGLFGNDNCSDQLKQYTQKPEKEHKGGFVKEESAIFLTAPRGSLTDELGGLSGASGAQAPAITAGGGGTFALPSGPLGQELRITSASGTPVVTISGPGGQTYTTPATGGRLVTVPGQFMSAVAPDPHQVLVLLRHPKGGTWHVQPAAGSPPVAGVEFAEDVAPATVKVKVRRHGHASRWALAYSIGHYVAGTKVQFVERGSDSTHVLGTVARAKGTLSFVPQEALGRSRKIYAYLLNGEGATVRELTVGRYTAPGAFRPAKPRHARIARHGTAATITWGAVAGAREYKIVVHGSDGRLQTFFRKPSTRSAQLVNVLPFESFTATILAEGGKNMLPGPKAAVRLAPLKIRVPRPPKHPRGKKKKG